MFQVVTFGSAIWDIFIRDKELTFNQKNKFLKESNICFPLGSKIDIDEIHFFSGGGGSNSAVTFSFQKIKTAYCGMLGFDPAGDEIIKELKKNKIDTSLIQRTEKKPTNHSFVLSIPKKDRTILVYRGASEFLSNQEIPWNKIKKNISKNGWFYLAPLSGKLSQSFEKIVNFAHKNKIKVAVNLGNDQLKMKKNKLIEILEKTDVLIINQEEAATLSGLSRDKEGEIFEKVSSFYPGIFVMTKGSKGASISFNNDVYSVNILKSKVVDRTGAGDSFGAAFVSGIIQNKDIEYSIQLASANATSCLKKWGAKNGLLRKGEPFKKIKVNKND
jgi:ribokinase